MSLDISGYPIKERQHSSGDDEDAEAATAAARRRVKRYMQEIRLERAVKEALPARAAASSAAAATALARVKLVLPGRKRKADGGAEPRFRGVRRRTKRRRPRTRPRPPHPTTLARSPT